MQLSAHFSLAELTHTNTGLSNMPDGFHFAILREHLAPFLEKVRDRALGGNPIEVHSAFRSPAVNHAVGGVVDSAHLSAYAADIESPAFGSVFNVALAILAAFKAKKIDFDQLIFEQTWVHVSCAPAERGMVLTHFDDGRYVNGLIAP